MEAGWEINYWQNGLQPHDDRVEPVLVPSQSGRAGRVALLLLEHKNRPPATVELKVRMTESFRFPDARAAFASGCTEVRWKEWACISSCCDACRHAGRRWKK